MSYITAIDVSLNEGEEEMLRGNGYIQIPVNTNIGNSGDKVYLWYMRGSSQGVTRVQLSFNDAMTKGLIEAGYQKIDKDLNAKTGGDQINLWYCTVPNEVPIVDLFIATEAGDEAQLFRLGWERLACNLNRKAGGKRIYLWVKREKTMYLCDIMATKGFEKDQQLFKKGFIRIDETTNRAAGGPFIFIWYLQKADSHEAITDLQVSTTKEEVDFWKNNSYSLVDQDLNEGTDGNQINLWYKRKESSDPIKTATLIVKKFSALSYSRAGVQIIYRNLNQGNEGALEYLCFYQ
ncbi:uncharacterized protein LOC133457675 [Cololabis saira]|uniref:uncharacterized protein LOC133457675 n=1 Tax=Cololabis saira TaxID=129043 RepID=UPI002AD27AF6|nr:uncharacterized protein LOC133457675 [Cololabis saira]